MANVVSNGLITNDGKQAILDANTVGGTIKLASFGYSAQDLTLDENLSAGNITPWYKGDIGSVSIIDDSTVELITVVEANEASQKCYLVAYYLEDGTLFALAKPFYPMPPNQRQVYETRYMFSNAANTMEFNYEALDEIEQYGAILDNSLTSFKGLLACGCDKITKVQGVSVR